MKNSIYKDFMKSLKSKWILGISTGMLLVSCGAQMGSYTETDGVYYDPKKDVIPEGYLGKISEGTDYDYYSNEDSSTNIIEQNQQNQLAQQNRYQRWNQNNSTLMIGVWVGDLLSGAGVDLAGVGETDGT